MLGNIALAKDDAAIGVNPAGDPVGNHLDAAVVNALDVFVPRGERVQVGD